MNPYTYKAISLEHHNKKLEDIFQLEKKNDYESQKRE